MNLSSSHQLDFEIPKIMLKFIFPASAVFRSNWINKLSRKTHFDELTCLVFEFFEVVHRESIATYSFHWFSISATKISIVVNVIQYYPRYPALPGKIQANLDIWMENRYWNRECGENPDQCGFPLGNPAGKPAGRQPLKINMLRSK